MNIPEILHLIPYLGLVTNRDGSYGRRPILTRIIEQSLPGLIVAGVGIYTNVQLLEAQVKEITNALKLEAMERKESVAELRSEVDTMRRDIYIVRGTSKGER